MANNPIEPIATPWAAPAQIFVMRANGVGKTMDSAQY